MEILREIPDHSSDIAHQATVVTIGNFDGVHHGHRVLIRTLIQNAKIEGLESYVITFEPHPLEVLRPTEEFLRLFGRDDQIQQMSQLGVQNFVIQKFDLALSRISAESFLESHVIRRLRPKHIVVGHDFSFGSNRSGSIPLLLEFSKKFNFELTVVPPQKISNEVVSSSRIRQLLQTGDVGLANQMLTRNYYLQGPVIEGDKRGRAIGFPTANLKFSKENAIQTGVYITLSTWGSHTMPSVTNIGHHPTIERSTSPLVETHILEGSYNLYGETLVVEFLKRLRPEKKFGSIEELRAHIERDKLEAIQHFADE